MFALALEFHLEKYYRVTISETVLESEGKGEPSEPKPDACLLEKKRWKVKLPPFLRALFCFQAVSSIQSMLKQVTRAHRAQFTKLQGCRCIETFFCEQNTRLQHFNVKHRPMQKHRYAQVEELLRAFLRMPKGKFRE